MDGWNVGRKILKILEFRIDDRERLNYGLIKSVKHFVSLNIPHKDKMSLKTSKFTDKL